MTTQIPTPSSPLETAHIARREALVCEVQSELARRRSALARTRLALTAALALATFGTQLASADPAPRGWGPQGAGGMGRCVDHGDRDRQVDGTCDPHRLDGLDGSGHVHDAAGQADHDRFFGTARAAVAAGWRAADDAARLGRPVSWQVGDAEMACQLAVERTYGSIDEPAGRCVWHVVCYTFLPQASGGLHPRSLARCGSH